MTDTNPEPAEAVETTPYQRVFYRPDYGRVAAALKALRKRHQGDEAAADVIGSLVTKVCAIFAKDYELSGGSHSDKFDSNLWLTSTMLPPPPMAAEMVTLAGHVARTRRLRNTWNAKPDAAQETVDELANVIGESLAGLPGFIGEQWQDQAVKRPDQAVAAAAYASEPANEDDDYDEEDEDDEDE